MGGGMMATDWTPVLIVLGLGLLAGLVLAIRFVRGAPAAAPSREPARGPGFAPGSEAEALSEELDLELRDLAGRRDALFARLAELEAAAPGEVGPARVAHERWDLELQAAEVLRRLAEAEARAGRAARLPARIPAAAAADAGEGPVRWKGLAYAIGGAAFFLAAILAVRQFSTQAPGMGTAPGATADVDRAHGGEAPPNPRIDALLAELAAHPDDLEVRLDLADEYLRDGRLFEAFEVARPVLEKEPENPRGLTYVAVVRLAMGQVEEAGRMLDTAVAKDPRLAEAWSYRGLVRFQATRFADAVADWEEALELRPDARESLAPLIAQAKELAARPPVVAAAAEAGGADLPPGHPPVPGAAAGSSGAAGSGAMPPGHPGAPGAATPAGHPGVPAPAGATASGAMPPGHPGAPGAAPAAVPADARLAGQVELSPAAAGRAAPGASLFVIVRQDGMAAGPPVAVRRIDHPRFPLTFALGNEHSMTGAPIPERMSLEVRLDRDGDAMSRDPADPVARRTGVAAGTRDLRLVLE